MINRKSILITITLAAFALILTFILVGTNAVTAQRGSNNPAADARENNQITFLQAAIGDTQDPHAQQALEEKINSRQQAADLRADALAQPAPSLQDICSNRVQLPDKKANQVLGILTVREDFLNPLRLIIANMWRGSFNQQPVELYAGAMLDTPEQGIVVLSMENLEIFTTIPDPNPDGVLTITAENDARLELTTANGATRYFDISAQQFVNDSETQVPAIDLPPAPTPVFDPCVQFDTP
ncbi:MAG: hypothetical protein CVU39_23315 [Chloroflexi bacterium HGW-Chloroflexi-10]|nr:MAG: hypothetical protein CVU39_23315 [Chloroflexi bacterium HGW-Chloroflexi-10]